MSFNIDSVGNNTSVVQTRDMIITSNHIMLVVGVFGSSITAVVERAIDGNNVMVFNHVVYGTSIYRDGIVEKAVHVIRRV